MPGFKTSLVAYPGSLDRYGLSRVPTGELVAELRRRGRASSVPVPRPIVAGPRGKLADFDDAPLCERPTPIDRFGLPRPRR